MSVPLIIDTDTAQDDCVALIAALSDPEADLRAITMVAGNIDFDRQVANAHMTLNACGRLGQVPVHLGCTQPMLHPWASARDVHGDGSGGLVMSLDGIERRTEHAVDTLIRHAHETAGELSIAAIGPLTNIAVAVVKDRTLPAAVRHLHIMGGSNNGRGNITAAAEFNFYVDPIAAQIVMAAGFPDITIFPWDPLTLRDATFPLARYRELCQLGTPLSNFFGSVCDTTLDFNESVGIDGSTHPDSMTVAGLLHPELIRRSAPYRIDVEYRSDLTRGYSSMAWDKFDLTPNATVVEQFDGEAFFAYLKGILSTDTEPQRELRGAYFARG